ncbi:hypothetical protein ANCDUO_17590 [Ancylostoma duodenale]|uniref:Uncharacterized protein n=1 Tax=Ancylostoma duodenale TaxID=51022 RepID=A0A0C2G065_9BILA|nr:hypothetical protein ANCDUO_17590 [Ancylostoma duodenale]
MPSEYGCDMRRRKSLSDARALAAGFVVRVFLRPLVGLICQCSSDAGGVPCYNGWCDVQNAGGKTPVIQMSPFFTVLITWKVEKKTYR